VTHSFAQKKVSGTLEPRQLLDLERLKVPDTFFWAKPWILQAGPDSANLTAPEVSS